LRSTQDGNPVAQLAATVAKQWGPRLQDIETVRILCLLRRFASDCKEPEYRDALKVPQWEIPICEFVVRTTA